MEVSTLKLYGDYLLPMTPSEDVKGLLTLIMSGGETTADIAEILERDDEIRDWILLTLKRLGRASRDNNLDYTVSILGLNRVRNLIVGRNIERALVPEAEHVLNQLKSGGNTEEVPANKEDSSANTEAAKAAEDEEQDEEAQTIPEMTDFDDYVKYSTRSEQVAIELRFSHPGQAFAAGVLYDYVGTHLQQNLAKFEELEIDELKSPHRFLEDIFIDGLKCGIAAEAIGSLISIKFQKNLFLASLLRNIGKVLLLSYDPKGYERVHKLQAEAFAKKTGTHRYELEDDEFSYDHAQISALLIAQCSCFVEIEQAIDFHHKPLFLKSRDKELYALSCVIRVGGLLVNAYEAARETDPDIEKMNDDYLRNTDAFEYLRITDKEWREIKSNYALSLLKNGL